MNFYQIINSLVTFFPLQVFLAISMFCFRLKRRKYFPIRYILSLIVFILATWFIPNLIIFSWFDIKYILILFIATLFMFPSFDISIRGLIFCSLAGYSVQHISFCMMILMRISFYGENNWINLLIYLLSFISVYIICYFLFAKRIHFDETRNMKVSKLLLLVGITIFITQILSLYLNNKMALNPVPRIYAIACSILVLIIQFDFFHENKLEKRNDIVEQLLRTRNEQYEISKKNIEVINTKVHDFKKSLSLYLSNDNQNIKKELANDLKQAINIYDSDVKTGNEAIDVLIMDKSIYCSKNSIKLSYIIDGNLLSFMNSADVFSLIGNMLDNAIERELKEDINSRIISIHVFPKAGGVFIHIENYCSSKIAFGYDGLPITSKSDKTEHGFGLQSIRFIVEKYNGFMNVYQEIDFFNVDVLFLETKCQTPKTNYDK